MNGNMTVATVVGARPQFIKLAAVSRQLRSSALMREILIHTGQHYDDRMSRVFFEELDIPRPHYSLNVGSSSHGKQTAAMLEGIESVLLREKPDVVVVYGDTNSTLAGALAAVKLHIPVAHVEAGLRSFNRRMPEEVNRVLTDHSSDILLAPTKTAVSNLLEEGIPPEAISLAGDVMYDAALYYAERANARSRILDMLRLRPKQYVLSTLHRAENTDDAQRLTDILGGLERIARDVPVVLPLHPRTRFALEAVGLAQNSKTGMMLLEPVGYLDMMMLEKNALVIVTDSGGVQKEAFFHGVPCVTLRDETEWTELLELRWNRLASPLTSDMVVQRYEEAIQEPAGKDAMPYGNGLSSEIIVETLREALVSRCRRC